MVDEKELSALEQAMAEFFDGAEPKKKEEPKDEELEEKPKQRKSRKPK